MRAKVGLASVIFLVINSQDYMGSKQKRKRQDSSDSGSSGEEAGKLYFSMRKYFPNLMYSGKHAGGG